jgi:Rhs element Vgr protein
MLSLFSSEKRLFDLRWRNDNSLNLQVEAWWGHEALAGGFELCVDLLSTDACIELKRLLGQAVTLLSSLSDGTRSGRSGLVRSVLKLGADGGFSRYRITIVPWSWLLTRGRHNRVFQEKTAIEIVEAVFADYADYAAWQWSDEVAGFLADARNRSYCVQYRESDYAFISRLLTEEGLGWCVEEDEAAPAGHRLRIFADTPSFPEDALSQHANGGQGIRFHRADSQEAQDAIVAFGTHRQLSVSLASAYSYDYKNKQAVAVSVPTAQPIGGEHAPVLESYDDPGLYAFASSAEAERYQRLIMEAFEARYQTFLGRGTVRTLRPGTCFDLVNAPLGSADDHRFAVVSVTHVGINNLSGEAMAVVAERLGKGGFLNEDADALAAADALSPVSAPTRLPAELIKLAAERGYGNSFECLSSRRPWRPLMVDAAGSRINPRPTVSGPMSAIVVGPQGETTPSGADELWCDALGRVKVRFAWQLAEAPDDQSTCWVRVVTRQSGPGMGWQWLPRIGQEVLVGFYGNDIDRPIVLGALFNGQGEGGVVPTTGGAPAGAADATVFNAASDHRPSGQGNLAGGNSPAWHGAAAESHGHAAALSGFKSKEFGGSGYNQLVLDDSDQQQRILLHTTQHASSLNLGHLIHQADNYRGSFRGTGAELRTDAWGALRGGRGLIMTTWAADTQQPAGDIAAGSALLKQAASLANTLSKAAGTHQTVKLASSIGSTGSDKSEIDPKAAPLKALATVADGMVDAKDPGTAQSDAQAKTTTTGQGKVPHLTDAAIIQAGKAGLGLVAGQHLQFANGETIVFESGMDSNFAIAGKARIHSGQAIGLLAGAIQPGEGNTGIKLIASKDDIDLQAQSDEMKFLAKKDVKLVSASANIDFAAAKKVHLAVAGGASITIDGGITVQCPGTITVHASKKSFTGPASLSREMNTWPKTSFNDAYVIRNPSTGEPLANSAVELTRGDGSTINIMTDAAGKTPLQKSDLLENIKIRLLN